MLKSETFINKCHDDFWYYPKRAFALMLWVFTIMAVFDGFAMNASAETGTITVSQTNASNYSIMGSNAGIGTHPPIGDEIHFDNGNWTGWTDIIIYANGTGAGTQGGFTSSHISEVSTFSIIDGGTGSGTFSYSVPLQTLEWTCNCVITSNRTNISYANGYIWGNITFGTGVGMTGANYLNVGTLNLTNPVIIGNRTSWWGYKGIDGQPTTWLIYHPGVDVTTTNDYIVTYPASGKFQIDVTKHDFPTKDFVNFQTGTYINDTTFNNASFSFLGNQLNGIYLNVTMQNGAFTNTLINSSGTTVVTPTPTPTPPQAGSTGGNISWDASSYNVGAIGTLTGNVTVSPPLFGDIRITVVNSAGQQAFFVWDSSGTFPQIESFLFSFPSADTYTASLISHSPFSGDTVLATATAQAVTPVSYIFAPATAVTGSNITISYKFNPAPATGAIEDVPKDLNGNDLPGIYFNTSLCSCDTSLHHINYTINGVGKHTFRLWDTTGIKVVASTIVDVTDVGTNPPQNITLNFLALDNTQYAVNDVINGQYQISTANWSTFGYFQASLISSGGIGMGAVTLTQQSGTFQIPVTGGAFGVFQSGLASVNITAGNSVLSATNQMVSAPVTILSTNGAYSVSANPNTICKTQIETVKYTGASGLGILQEIYMTPAGTTKINNYSFTQNGTRQFIYNDGTVKNNGGIIYSVLDTNGNFQVNTIIKYKSTDCTAPGITPPAGVTPPPTGTQQASAVVTLITSNIFWALTITVGLMIAIAWKTKDGFPTGTIGVLVSGIFTFLGWLPAWIFFTMFVIGALFIAASIVEKQMRNVTQ